MKNYSINISFNKNTLEIIAVRGELTIRIITTLQELNHTYGISPQQIDLEVIKQIVLDNKLRITKTYSFISLVEEWTSEDGNILFKKEDGLIVAFRKEDTSDFIYLKETDLPKNKHSLNLTGYIRLKIKKEKEKEEALRIAKNINNSMDFGFDFKPDNF